MSAAIPRLSANRCKGAASHIHIRVLYSARDVCFEQQGL